AFLDLVKDGRVSLRPLIDRVYGLAEAPAAYEAIDGVTPAGRPIGVLLNYGSTEDAAPGPRTPVTTRVPNEESAARAPFDPLPAARREIGGGLCGAGAFVKSIHLPALKRAAGFVLRGVATASPLNARATARRFGIPLAAADLQEILRDESIDLVLIGTRHHL